MEILNVIDYFMAKRVVTKVGDVFCANIDGKYKRYLQYIVSDLEQLNSDVIRVFKEKYPIDAEPKLDEVVKGEVDFYAHCVVSGGVKRGLWEKVGKCADVGDVEHIIFRCKGIMIDGDFKDDYGWRVWYVNQPMVEYHSLRDEHKQSFLGSVFLPESILYKMKNGLYIGATGILELDFS